jgi:putative MATE family efflux protein
MADMIIAGNFIGSAGISSITNSSQVMMLITQVVIGLTTGGNILIGQYFGSKKYDDCKKASVTLITFSLALGIGLMAAVFCLAGTILRLLDAPDYAGALAYLKICSLGFLFICGYNGVSAAIRAVGNSRQPLVCIAASTVVNIILDLLFTGALKMGTAGAALATVIAQGVSFGISLVFVLRHRELFGLSLRRMEIKGALLRRILRLGLPCAVQMSVAGISWLSVTFIVNSYGVHVSAGNGVSIKIKDFCQTFISAMASGASAMIAQNLGAKEYDRAKEVLRTAMGITVCMALCIICVVEIFAPQLVSLFTSDPEDAAAAVMNLRIEIIGQLFYASFLVYHALAVGAGHTIFVLISSFTNCILVRLVLAFTLNHFFGITGLYIACMAAPASSVPLGWLYTRSNRWKRSLAEA